MKTMFIDCAYPSDFNTFNQAKRSKWEPKIIHRGNPNDMRVLAYCQDIETQGVMIAENYYKVRVDEKETSSYTERVEENTKGEKQMTTMFKAFMKDYSANITSYREMQKFNTEFLKGVSKSERARLTEGLTNRGGSNVSRLFNRINNYEPQERKVTELTLDQIKASVRGKMIAKGYRPAKINQAIKRSLKLHGRNNNLRTRQAWLDMVRLIEANQH